MRAVLAGVAVLAVLAAVAGGLIGATHPTIRLNPGKSARRGAASRSSRGLPGTPSAAPDQLAPELDRAQATIDSPASSSAQLSGAAWFEQLATLTLAREPGASRNATLARLDPRAAATMRANLAAAAALAGIVKPRRSLPPWKIVQPPPPAILLADFRAAGSRFGVSWEYLAAIEFIETKFGRVAGLSSTGAEGPMQFMPSTWAHYGSGDVYNPRDAILGAARYLVAGGARGDITAALYHYNPSTDYVNAVTDYASRMRADPRAYDGYYYWQVIYAQVGRLWLLPVGYPKLPAAPVPR